MTVFHAYGALAVSISATLSFVACITLGSFIAFLSIRFRHTETKDTPASSGIRFLRSQAGYLFVNLLVADFMQAVGFGLSYTWYGKRRIDESAHVCTFQALAIEAGDVASAVFSLYIALHTAAMFIMNKKASSTLLRSAVICGWIFVVILTAIGPLAIYKPTSGPFYGAAGNWCWIAPNYDTERLHLHYLWLFISAAGQLVSYIAIFVKFQMSEAARRARLDHSQSKLGISSAASSPVSYRKPGQYGSPISASPSASSTSTQRPTTSSSYLMNRRNIDKKSLVMLLYPLVNMCIIMPLSVYRLYGIAGRQTSPQGLAICGSIFSLGGFANAVLYTFSRHLLRVGPAKSGRMPCPEQPGTPSTPAASWNAMFRTPGGTPSSDVTRVDSPSSTPFASTTTGKKLKELRLSPASSISGSTVTSPSTPIELEKPALALLPAVRLVRSASSRSAMTGGDLKPAVVSRATTPTFDVALVKVDKETVTWSEK